MVMLQKVDSNREIMIVTEVVKFNGGRMVMLWRWPG